MGVSSFEPSLSISLALGLLGLCSLATATRPEDKAPKNHMQGCILHRTDEPGYTSILGPKTQMTALMSLMTLDGYLFVIFSLLDFFWSLKVSSVSHNLEHGQLGLEIGSRRKFAFFFF